MAEMRTRYIRTHSFSQEGVFASAAAPDAAGVAAARAKAPAAAPAARAAAATKTGTQRIPRQQWLLQQYYKRQCLIGGLWLLAGALLTLVGFGVHMAWDDLKGAPLGSKLYTLTLPCCWWLVVCCFLSVCFGVAAVTQSFRLPRGLRGRQSVRSGVSSRSSRSPSVSRRRRAAPFGRRRRAASPGSAAAGAAAAAADGDQPTLGEVGMEPTTESGGDSSGSGGAFSSDEQQQQQQQQAFGSQEIRPGLSKAIGDGPLNRKLTPRPSGEAFASPSRAESAAAKEGGAAAALSRHSSSSSKRQGSLVKHSSTRGSRR
ncbi:hypothetical protein, conserved [Eimeria necatrix]|uniref:Uncharacterized protein n=1 Tax=Eimeria necatrix TaxID=51315 RepID=U6MKY0_9EIME|nr:hypothetical protein, conserved [Eimeria necatrix]CDJ64907.1 hypothetical protein, conserved [Eimeria necatrix]